jgi:UDP-glucuronate decarboxylase
MHNDSPRKRTLVTGGAGCLGSHLCKRLLERGDDVLCVNNFFTGIKDNVRHLFDNSLFERIRHDATGTRRRRSSSAVEEDA